MVRLIARTAVATALAAAVAAPLTLSASAATAPSVSPLVQNLQQTVQNLVPVPLAPLVPAQQAPATSSTSSSSSNTDSSSQATANALDLPPLNTCVSCTNGSSSTPPTSSSANSNALTVLGIPLSKGSASTGQTNNGALLALPANPLVSLALADWLASATNAPSTFERASLLDLDLNPDGSPNKDAALTQLATLALLEAKSTTTASCEAGGATGETNGADLNLGQGALAVILLHANASTNSPGSVYLASINGTQILNSSQVGGNPISIAIPGLTTITLIAQPQSGCGNNGGNPSGCSGIACVQLPPGTTLGTGFQATQSATSSNSSSGVQAASTGSGTGGVGVPTTGIGMGILGFLILGGGLLALGASRVARRWRALT